MKTEKNELVSATGKLQPYRPNSIEEHMDERKYGLEVERIIYLIYRNQLEPKEVKKDSVMYCFLDYEGVAKQLGTNQYLTMIALEAVKRDIIPDKRGAS